MATTTNYSWTTPDDTALVKDGAAAIRTLGSSIDTTTKNLNPQTTTGAIAFRSATSNVNTSLAIGTAGQVLTVNSGATAPEWASPTSGGMTLLTSGTVVSGNASLSLTSISGSYEKLVLVLFNWRPATDDQGLRIQFNTDTGTNYLSFTSNTAQLTNTAFNADAIVGTGLTDSTTNNGFSIFEIPNYAKSGVWKQAMRFGYGSGATTTANITNNVGMGYWNGTAAISSIQLYWATGNLSAGTYELWGVK